MDRSRGAEVDAAAAAPVPAELLAGGLPRGQRGDMDLEGAKVVPPRPGWGVYVGIYGRDDPGRATLLTPQLLARAAFLTSGRIYAWYVLDSPEACFAVRAGPRGGHALDLDPDAIVEWLRPRLRGEPPHKMDLDEYLAHLRGLGLTVEVGARRQGEVRFNLVDTTTAAEREKATQALLALDADAFARLDWAEYDATVGREVIGEYRETAGDVAIDLEKGTVSVPKVRQGIPHGTYPHTRSYVTFHTHPYARYRGHSHEPPSEPDLVVTLAEHTYWALVWHFVTAPEGTYILRPGRMLATFYYRNPREARDCAIEAYFGALECHGSPAACARRTVEALREAGFVAYFHPAAGAPLLDRPDLEPGYNLLERGAYAAALEALRKMPGPELLAADWSRVVSAFGSPLHRGASWVRATCEGGVVTPGVSHTLRDPADVRSYPQNVPGPLMVLHFADADFPPRVPAAAIEVARDNAREWPWMAFLSERRVQVFRADDKGFEAFGPRALEPPAP